jgi:hypothetical protein
MVCQLPNRLRRTDFAYQVADPGAKWDQVRTILELVAAGKGNLKKLHFLLFPESTMPAACVPEALTLIEQQFRPNTVTVFGVEHIRSAMGGSRPIGRTMPKRSPR